MTARQTTHDVTDISAADSNAAGSRSAGGSRFKTATTLAAILLLGMGLRAWLAMDAELGHDSDIGFFVSWTRTLHEHGIGGFFEAQRFCDYPPLSLLFFVALGHAAQWLYGGLGDADAMRVLLKIPACLADLAIGIMIFIEARRLLGARAGNAAAALFVLNPVIIYNTAYWGQIDSLFTAFVLLAFLFVGRRCWHLAGAAAAAGLLIKFQAIAFVPLLLFEAYRIGRWRAVGGKLVAALALASCVLLPFAWQGVMDDVLQRSYVNVVGQYNDLSKSAYNLWYAIGDPHTADTGIPAPIVAAVAQGRTELSADASWMLRLNWRTISLIIFALMVAIVLSLYSRRPTEISCYGAARLLGLAFFVFPTEMHERYALPAVAFLAVWTASSQWKERVFYILSAMLLLNLAAVLPAEAVAAQIGGTNLLIFAALLGALAWTKRGEQVAYETPRRVDESDTWSKQPALVVWFRRATAYAVVGVVFAAAWVGFRALSAPPVDDTAGSIYLSTLTPRSARQGWGKLARDGSVSGGALTLDGRIYTRGLGTHTPSRLEYDIPPGCTEFRAIVGLDRSSEGKGSAVIAVELDGERAYVSPCLTEENGPLAVRVPLNGARRLVLVAEPTRDGSRSDHVDWALARFTTADLVVGRVK